MKYLKIATLAVIGALALTGCSAADSSEPSASPGLMNFRAVELQSTGHEDEQLLMAYGGSGTFEELQELLHEHVNDQTTTIVFTPNRDITLSLLNNGKKFGAEKCQQYALEGWACEVAINHDDRIDALPHRADFNYTRPRP